MKFQTSLYLNNTDLDIEVTYKYYKGSRGSRDSLGGKRGAGPQLEPDDPPEVEILSIVNLKDGVDLLDVVPSQDLDIIEAKCWEHFSDQF